MKKFEKPEVEFIPFGEDIITTSLDKPVQTIKNDQENVEKYWSGLEFQP